MIRKRGKEYHYQFMQDKKLFYGVCEGCSSEKAALAFEKKIKDVVKRAAEQKNIRALVENFRDELTGGEKINIDEAFELSLRKPRKRTIGEKKLSLKRGIWSDFAAFMRDKYPDVEHLANVSARHAEEYIALIRTSGRHNKLIEYRRGNKIVRTKTTGCYSGATSNLYQTVCAEVFKLLAKDAGIIDNPFGMEKVAKNEETREAFSQDEIILIRDNLDDFTRPLFTLAMMTALREGDICLLRWSDIDFKAGMIRRRMNKTGGIVEIPVADDLLSYLRSCKKGNDTEYVFPDHAKMYLENQSGVSYRVKRFLERIGIKTTKIPPGRSRAISVKDLHSCRHTFCYYAGIRGIPLSVVQSIVGHMSPEMTRHYSNHATWDDKRRNMRLMSDFMSLDGLPQGELSARERLIEALDGASEERILAALEVLRGKDN